MTDLEELTNLLLQDEAFKKECESLLHEMERKLEVSADPFYSKENMECLRSSISQMESSGESIHKVEKKI